MCFDGVKRLCHIRGKLRKKVWINETVDFVGGDLDDDIEFGSDCDSDDSGSGDDANDIDGIQKKSPQIALIFPSNHM